MRNLIFVFALFSAFSANAGGIKDLYIEHQEEVAMALYGNPDPYAVNFQSTQFTAPQDPKASVALESVVLVYAPGTGGYKELSCMTEFKKLESDSFKALSTVCN